jgi:maleate cis-trans isomerase
MVALMFGWRARIGVLVPPGNPTMEPELYRMAPDGVSLHFARLEEAGAAAYASVAGGAAGLDDRIESYVRGLPGPARALSAVRPSVVVFGMTAASYGPRDRDAALVEQLAALTGTVAITAAGAIRTALEHLGVKRLALGTPYPEAISLQGRAYWEAVGFRIVGYHRLPDVDNIYAENEQRAYQLARAADAPDADAVLLSGTGLPTASVLDVLERDLGKPVISSNQACLWHALHQAGIRGPVHGFGSLLAGTRP